MSIEIRTKDGNVVADVKGSLASTLVNKLKSNNAVKQSSKNIKGKGIIDVLIITQSQKLNLTDDFTLWLIEESYIKYIW